MNSTSIILMGGSLTALVFGSLALRRTGSRGVFMNTLLGTFGLLVAAADAVGHRMERSFTISMFIGMLFAGRGAAFLWRSRREPELKAPGLMLGGVALVAACGAVNAFFNL